LDSQLSQVWGFFFSFLTCFLDRELPRKKWDKVVPLKANSERGGDDRRREEKGQSGAVLIRGGEETQKRVSTARS